MTTTEQRLRFLEQALVILSHGQDPEARFELDLYLSRFGLEVDDVGDVTPALDL